jgi:hypothetical protein
MGVWGFRCSSVRSSGVQRAAFDHAGSASPMRTPRFARFTARLGCYPEVLFRPLRLIEVGVSELCSFGYYIVEVIDRLDNVGEKRLEISEINYMGIWLHYLVCEVRLPVVFASIELVVSAK